MSYSSRELSIELPGYGMYTVYTCLPSAGIYGAKVARNYTQTHKIHIFKDVQIAKKHVNQVIKSMQWVKKYIIGLQNVVESKYKVTENGK